MSESETSAAASARTGAEGAAASRELGEQPLARLMRGRGLSRHDLVAAAAPGTVTHKLVKRAETGRRLTLHSKNLVLRAYNAAAGASASLSDLFDY
ncbi:MAG: hypothetical protein IJ783_00630 [Kiritimatiellae bacterium]|nr:hypothetical protein [Kiritimatiellia bacterium]